MSTEREIRDHQTWLGYLQPEGLVVSPAAMVDTGLIFNRNVRLEQTQLIEHLRDEQAWDESEDAVIQDFPSFLTGFLGWPEEAFVPAEKQPNDLARFLPEYQETLQADYAIRNLDLDDDAEVESEAERYLMLFHVLPRETALDKPMAEQDRGWETTPARRFERLLRETGVGTGLLTNGTHIRVIHSPPGENPGSITFPISAMTEVSGRLIFSGFYLLFEEYRVFTAPEKETLLDILKKSRDFQANVSTELAQQVLDGLYELLRGLQAAHAKSGEKLLVEALKEAPQSIYEAMLNVLMRLVFLLFAEDNGLMPKSSLYQQNYSLHTLYERLRTDRERYPDTMDQRYGAWAQLLALFRLIHTGSRHRDMGMPARHGYLFDPDRFPFLEGDNLRQGDDEKEGNFQYIPRIPDHTIVTVLEKLLYLKGERLSYRTLDVEQIGSVYETMMGFKLEVATGQTIALKPKKKHGAPSNINLEALVNTPAKDRPKRITELTDRKLPTKKANAIKEASSIEEIMAALDDKSERSALIARNATPTIAHPGALLLQPSDARRKSGSHYTPRKLTQPIVEKALEPILANLVSDRDGEGEASSSNREQSTSGPSSMGKSPGVSNKQVPFPSQILDLKICDPAVGSGAFLVEACRQLAEQLVKAWAAHGGKPNIPDDEDEIIHARRLVAQRCLYGVDRNPMAADLAKLSLWLATLAKDHPFTFLDHSIRAGDSLVGLSKEQILAFHWDLDHPTALQPVFGQDRLQRQLKSALAYRQEILQGGDYVLPEMKAEQLRLADEALRPIRFAGDLAVLSFFLGTKPKERQEARDLMLDRWQLATDQSGSSESLHEGITLKEEICAAKRAEKPVFPFHWEIEFPEVFERTNSGFSAFVGNPPYAGKNTLASANSDSYPEWLRVRNVESHGNADLIAHFFRLSFSLLRDGGTFGLVATNTIRQGDTRSSGLKIIIKSGGSVYRAETHFQWPGQAAVTVSIVWVQKRISPTLLFLDGKPVEKITAYLFHEGDSEDPIKLDENQRRIFIGSYILGNGFIFSNRPKDLDEGTWPLSRKDELLKADSKFSNRIFKYIGGAEVNERPGHTSDRFIMSFDGMPLSEAQNWGELFNCVKQRVKPQREAKQKSSVDKQRAKYWWHYASGAKSLYDSIGNLNRVFVRSLTSKHFCAFTFIDDCSGYIFDQTLVVCPFETSAIVTVLVSRPHEMWALFFGATLEDRPRYNVDDCFKTFPFPKSWESDENLKEIGGEYFAYRAELMFRNDEGLTKTYNRFHNPAENSPEIQKLRKLHADMDRAVLDSYGWTGVPTDCEFIPDFIEEDDDGNEVPKNIRYRWPDEVRDDVLARLLALNTERYEEELAQGLHK